MSIHRIEKSAVFITSLQFRTTQMLLKSNAAHFSYRYLLLATLLAFVTLFAGAASHAQPVTQGELLKNGGFEGGSGADGKGGGAPRWDPFETGYDIDRKYQHGGDQCIRCDSVRSDILQGAVCNVELNQKDALPVFVSGWSRADRVSGSINANYSLYVDLIYTDGEALYGQSAAFRTGTHGWERKQILIFPKKPIKSMSVYALFRKHAGTAWFDDFSAHQLEGGGIFDSQPLLLPSRTGLAVKGENHSLTAKDGLGLVINGSGDIIRVRTGEKSLNGDISGGFYVRDVDANSPIVPIRGEVRPNKQQGFTLSSTPGMRLTASIKVIPDGDTLAIDGEINDVSKQDRAVTVYFALPALANGWVWGDDIRQSRKIDSKTEYANLVPVNVGAVGGMSLYPYACISDNETGIGIANQMDMPSVTRIFYNAPSHQFVIAWDFGLAAKSGAWPASNARFRCRLFHLPAGQAEWGFRAASKRFYKLNSPNFDRLAKRDGIWMPFTDPSKIQQPEDFSIAYHEGDNSIKSDDAAGILSFRYTEPMSWWMNMPKEMPRTYENAIAYLEKLAKGTPEDKSHELQNMAKATLNSGTQDENGRFNLEFRNEPWANGAVFVLNPNPELPSSPEKPTKASVSYSLLKAMAMYSKKTIGERGEQDGEYLDSLESWSDVLDFRPSNLYATPYPITFDTNTRRPVIPQWFSTHTFTRFLRDDLHNRGKLLFANTSPVRFTIFSPLLDVAGIEVNWLNGDGSFQPDSDAVMNLRRTMSFQKPYLLLQNTDYEKFTHDLVERYFQRCLFYGIFPSMFSANAAENPYWENPKWYNRDRDLFKKYLPMNKSISAAGWEPVTFAKSDSQVVSVERFGNSFFTILNSSGKPLETTLNLDLAKIGKNRGQWKLVNQMTGETLVTAKNQDKLTLALRLAGEQVMLLKWAQ